ncbi:hypothetical protein AYO21_06086 [Fonsecaea monophora]|uniref:Uncharacterized protein n=1 Tax=Fonsecaea monophora TaxID=254056 RepID=A0A177F5W4_9EURO|nr:hypothetical protein AYO21_06086 [Fonsecaea monophora]OAG39618.1 hypothetical protein AYO21_06086 [Fonsecaea monophora]
MRYGRDVNSADASNSSADGNRDSIFATTQRASFASIPTSTNSAAVFGVSTVLWKSSLAIVTALRASMRATALSRPDTKPALTMLYRQSPKRDQVLCPFSPTSNISQASKHPVAVPCGEPHESDPNVHMVRTSNDMHAFLSLESEGWTRSQASSHSPAVRPKRGDGSRGLVRAVAKGNEPSLLADYGARIWRELTRTTAEHLISYRCK